MTPEQYAALQAAISAQAVNYVGGFGKYFTSIPLNARDWLQLLELLWPAVKQARDESADLARTFYDQQRDLWHPDVPNIARKLDRYEFQWFVQDMEPVRKVMSQPDAPPAAVEALQLQVQRSVENGGRRQIIHTVEADIQLDKVPQPDHPVERVEKKSQTVSEVIAELERELANAKRRVSIEEQFQNTVGLGSVRGWARVATGDETCAWCLMLVSRGPVYESARAAGLNMDSGEATYQLSKDKDVSEAMNQWHPGCDCKVVPVFHETQWVGKEAADKALDFWIEAGKRASKELEDNPGKQYYSFKDRGWRATTENRETINQLRAMIDSGEIKSSDWAALQIA